MNRNLNKEKGTMNAKPKKEIDPLEVFTPEMLADAKKCKNAQEIMEKVIIPNIEMINEKTGQDNDPRYWAYAMEFTLGQLKLREKLQ